MTSKKSGTIDPKFDIPEIEVTFKNGVTKKLVLNHHDAIPNSDFVDRSRLCNYLGHLEGDEMNSIVAVTGCLMGDRPDEKMYVTLLSQHSPKHKTFSVNKYGNTKHIEVKSQNEDISFLDDRPTETKDSRRRVRRDNKEGKAVPFYLSINVRIGYDKSTSNYFNGNREDVDNWLAEVMTQAQIYYIHESLKHNIILQVVVVKCQIILLSFISKFF